MRFCSVAFAAPSAACDTFVVLNATVAEQVEVLVQVSTLRFNVFESGSVCGSFPRRITSATPPFSTIGPSARSEKELADVEHMPALVGEKSQYEPLSVVQ